MLPKDRCTTMAGDSYRTAFGHTTRYLPQDNNQCPYEAFMSKQSKGGSKSQKLIKKRMENSLPLSLSRWFSGLFKKKK
jgi:hypothetical protein